MEKGPRILAGNNTGGWSPFSWSYSKQTLLVNPNMNRKKVTGLEDTKAVYVEKLLKQYYEPAHISLIVMWFFLKLR